MKLNKYVRRNVGLVVFLGLVLSSFAIALPMDDKKSKNKANESPWPMFRHDLKHTGYTAYTGPATPALAWTFAATDGIVSSPAIGADGTIYVGAGWKFSGATDHHLYALNPDGTLKWSYEGGDGFFSSAALGPDKMIYITSLNGNIIAIEDKKTYGERKWKTYLDWTFNLSSPAIGEDGTIYVGSPSFSFYAVNPNDGSIRWSYPTGWCIISSPAIGDDGTIYVGSKDHNLYAFDEALQGPKWQYPTGTFYDGHLADSSPAIGADGTIYFGTDPYGAYGQDPIIVDTNFWAVNPDGTLKWCFETEDGVESSPAIGTDGTVYFGSYDNYLYAVTDNGHEGVLKWKFPTNGSIDGSPTVDGDGVIYFGSRDSTLYALYANGTVKWTFQANDGFECSPTIDDNGYLYIGSFDGNLYALGTGAPDVGVASVDIPNPVKASTSYVPKATIRNYRGIEQEFDVSCVIRKNGTIVYNDTVLVTIPGGTWSQQSFALWQVEQDLDVYYTATVNTMLPGDENIDNNERTVQVYLEHTVTRFGNVNKGAGDAVDVLFLNGSAGDALRVYSIPRGMPVTLTIEAPPSPYSINPYYTDKFAIYVIQYKAGPADVSTQPYDIGTSCMPMPLSKGSVIPPPITLANNIGFKKYLGFPTINNIPPAPCTIFNVTSMPPGTYTLQGYLFDGGSAGKGVSLTNAIVLKVE